MSLTESREELRLQLRRELHATEEEVFDALVNPDKQAVWLSPPGAGGAVETTVDLRVGGAWEARFRPNHLTEVHDVQTYVVIDRPHRLVTDLVSESVVEGQSMPPLHSRVDITLEPTVWGTLMTVEQSGFPDVEIRDFFETVVWPAGLDRIESFLTAR
ncbi:SRPBCC family protein [Microbacterium ureisolvens]|uniref:SRPBCC domain-containing protein n=1 Tax=Microbacterium ureisolvens TaxID=2781186 RepID=A0ABS7I3K5_9MICO|nr:SRPBCC domain-containing protein [Microbacterium ureisolvens]MBW9111392.1 SRPBCC domain-containing protein [Microbacterium ureisolvens]